MVRSTTKSKPVQTALPRPVNEELEDDRTTGERRTTLHEAKELATKLAEFCLHNEIGRFDVQVGTMKPCKVTFIRLRNLEHGKLRKG